MGKITDRRKFRRRVPQKPIIYPAKLGDGQGNVIVADMPNYVYCRIGSQVEIVYNDRVTNPTDDMAVDVGRSIDSPERFQVLGTRSYSPSGIGSGVQTGYAPAIRYQWMAEGGGQDPLYVQNRQIAELAVYKYSGMTVCLHPGTVWNGSTLVAVDYQTIDLTAHKPATTGKAAFVVVTVNTSGTVTATKGSEFTLADMTTNALMLANLPAIPASTSYVSAYVRLYEGQTEVVDDRYITDIIDVRFGGINSIMSSITAHASTHISTGSDPIANAVAGGASGLMSGADKTKLDGIASGAEVNVNADWSAVSGDAEILNKPTIPAALIVQEEDGTPTGSPATLKVPNGSLTDNGDGSFSFAPSGTGDVVGPASATDGHLVVFDGATGKLVKDGGPVPALDGWITDSNTWTYASASTFTVPGDQTAIFTKGARLKWTQTSVKYGVVQSSSYSAPNTTVTIVVNTDYTIANAAISANYYSRYAQPLGWPAWFNYAPIFTGFSTDPTILYCVYNIIGSMCFVALSCSVNGTSNATNFKVSMPVTPAITINSSLPNPIDNGSNSASGIVLLTAGDSNATLFKSAATSWTASGGKRGNFEVFFQW